MTLIVEDGTVVAGAESYVTIAEYKAYADARGISYSGITDATLEQNARKAYDYLLRKYRGSWKGYRKTATQTGDWPRSFVYLEPFVQGAVGSYPYLVDEDSIPNEIKQAQFELMTRVATDDLMPDLGQQETSVTVGPISVDYDKYSSQATRYEVVDNLLRVYLANGGAINSTVKRS